ncbi:MAG: nitroreductase family protein [Deltaproteobacteria bacterium]|nr:nitroreductase family protein [Deltaproteobacteria bacterium]
MNRVITLESKKCKKCYHCVQSCPENVFEIGEGGYPSDVRADLCIFCGHCVAVCQYSALTHYAFSVEEMLPVEKFNFSTRDTRNLLQTRRSIRSFSDKPLESRIIRHLIETAHMAPSEYNNKEREYTVITDSEKISEMEKDIAEHYQTLMLKFNPLTRKILGFAKKDIADQFEKVAPDLLSLRKRVKNGLNPVFRQAPCLIFIHAPRWNIFGRDNCTHAADYLMLYAHSAGIGSCSVGYAVAAESIVRKHVRIPSDHRIYSCIALGYPDVKYYRDLPRSKPCIRWV